MSDQELLKEVPSQLKRLVRLVARAFYREEHIVVLDVLVKYPCVTESDLVEVLKMHGCVKQLRQWLSFLKRDQLVKTLQKMENDTRERAKGSSREGAFPDGERQHMRLVNYWYINYKQFVNVVKYKLDQMRKKIESEQKKAQNRTSYHCPLCSKTFSDLDVDRLFDPTEGTLKCSHCGTSLEEEQSRSEACSAPMLLSSLNEQVSPVLVLLKEVDRISLAPEVLEPEVQSIEKHLLARGLRLSTSGIKKMDDQTWTTRETVDLYGSKQSVSVNIGAAVKKEPSSKERPVWLAQSTVYQEEEEPGPAPLLPGELPDHMATGKTNVSDHQIMADILAHERKLPGGLALAGTADHTPFPPALETAEYHYSSSSSEDEEMEGAVGGDGGEVWEDAAVESEEEEEEEFTVRIGDEVVAVDDVTDDMVARMTLEEKQAYTELCQRAYSSLY